MKLEKYQKKVIFLNSVYFIAEGKVKFETQDEIVFTTYSKGTYFGEIEIIRKTYRDCSTRAEDFCNLLTMKKCIVWDDVYKSYEDFFQTLVDNMVKRHNFYEKMKDIIDDIIEDGKQVISPMDLDNLKQQLKKSNKININRHFFFVGLIYNLNSSTDVEKIKAIKKIMSYNTESEELNSIKVIRRQKRLQNLKNTNRLFNKMHNKENINYMELLSKIDSITRQNEVK